jgi:hypothetical protein
VVHFTPWPLYPQGKSPWYPLDRRLGGPQSWSGHGGEEKNFQPLPGLESLIIQLIVQCYTTELSWLLLSKIHWTIMSVLISVKIDYGCPLSDFNEIVLILGD